MAWFLPSYGRPERLRELLAAPGGWPDQVHVLVNEDDPERERYFQIHDHLIDMGRRHWLEGNPPVKRIPWRLVLIPAGSRCADAHRWISDHHPNDGFYGLLCDDQWPITPGWHQRMAEAAEDRYFVTPAGEPSFPKMRNAVAIGGEIVRAMGSLVPCPVKHNYEDNLWDQVAADFGLLRPLPDVIVEHRHHIHGTAKTDATYKRGSSDIDQDRAIFEDWMRSAERVAMSERIAKRFGRQITTLDTSKIRLAIATPMQDCNVDVAYHTSLTATLIHLMQSGVSSHLCQTSGGSDIGKAREGVLYDALRTNPTHILFIDADMGWQPELVMRLLAADHEFAAAVGVKKTDNLQLCANFLPNPQQFHPVTKFLKAKDVGFAFVLLKVSVIEKMCAAYPDLRYNAGDKTEHALFLQMIDDGERLSEDFSFCRRWLKIGGEIWLDPHAALIHAGRKEYTGRLDQVFKYMRPEDIAA